MLAFLYWSEVAWKLYHDNKVQFWTGLNEELNETISTNESTAQKVGSCFHYEASIGIKIKEHLT